MRPKVKICGEVFDVDTVEGGKLRASSASLPGFELIAPNHNMLRERMQKALAAYDAEQLTKPEEPAATPQMPANISYIDVYDSFNNAHSSISTRLLLTAGVVGNISQCGIEYKTQRFLSASPQRLIAILEGIVRAAEVIGAKQIVWRIPPEIKHSGIDINAPFELYARFHFEPQFVNAQITWHQNGMPIQIV